MNTTAYLLSTKANKKRLLESIDQDKKASGKAGIGSKGRRNTVEKK